MELVIAFVLGLIVMDLMWAWRLGIPQMLWARWKYRKVLKQMSEQEQS
jgi:Tfp pilus assembly protein PilW